MSADTTCGARAPVTSTAPMTTSAARTASATSETCGYSPVTFAPMARAATSLSRSLSNTMTSAPRPAATSAALPPATPPPSTTTRPRFAAGTPPNKMPLPPCGWCSSVVAYCMDEASRDVTHRRQQRQPAGAVFDRFERHGGEADVHSRRVSSGSAARCR